MGTQINGAQQRKESFANLKDALRAVRRFGHTPGSSTYVSLHALLALDADHSSARAEIELLKSERQQLQDENAKLREENRSARSHFDAKLREQHHHLKNLGDSLNSERDTIKQMANTIICLRSENAALKANLADIETKLKPTNADGFVVLLKGTPMDVTELRATIGGAFNITSYTLKVVPKPIVGEYPLADKKKSVKFTGNATVRFAGQECPVKSVHIATGHSTDTASRFDFDAALRNHDAIEKLRDVRKSLCQWGENNVRVTKNPAHIAIRAILDHLIGDKQ